MKKYIKTAAKYYNYRLDEEHMADRLNIPASDVKAKVFQHVNPQDLEIFQYLVDNKVIPTIVSSGNLRNNPYYGEADKFIKVVKTSSSSRTYAIPVAGGGRFGTGSIFEYHITVNDDGTIQFGNSKIVDPYNVKPATLKSYFFKYGY